MGLRTKLLSGFFILALMLLISGIWSIYVLNSFSTSVLDLLDENYQTINSAQIMLEALEREDSGILILTLGKGDEGKTILYSADSVFYYNLELANNNITIPGEQDYLDSLTVLYKDYKNSWENALIFANEGENLKWYFDHLHESFLSLKVLLNELINLNQVAMYNTASGLGQRANRAIMPGIIAVISAFLFALLFSYLANYFIVNPIVMITKRIKLFIERKVPFAVEIQTKDEIYDLENSISRLCSLVETEDQIKMRFYIVIRYVALAFLLNSIFLGISALISAISGDNALIPLSYTAVICFLFGIFPLIFVPPAKKVTNKEGLLIVTSSWLLSCLLGTIPYILWGGEFSITNAWFESVSGFTTTGSTILTNIEALPAGLLFWRASTHWIGGIGIVIFVLSVLPYIGLAETVLYRTEISPLLKENFHQRASRAINILVGVYMGLTILEVIFLLIFGMNLFDAVTHSFATIATGGFSTKNLSIAHYNSVSIEIIILIFMVLSGVHFAVLFSAVSGRIRDIWTSPIVRYYLLILFISSFISGISLYYQFDYSLGDAFRYASFQIVSVGTSTGFATADSSIWSPLPHLIIIFLTLQCACSGSTSGGIKVDRVVILWKTFLRQLKRVKHPNAVVPVRLGNESVDEDLIQNSLLYIAVYLLIVFISSLLLTLLGNDLLTSFSGTIAAMGNVGPGLGSIGSLGNFSEIPALGKWILSGVMLLGRFEIYALLIFFSPRQWRKTISY